MKVESLILILDDDPDICTMIKIMLEYQGYSVMTAGNQAMTKIILTKNKVDLVVMDMLLSGTDGTELCQELKTDPVTSAIPIIMFSAHPSAAEICLAAGADAFIAKPFEMDDMLRKIRNLLKSHDGITGRL